MRPVPLHGISCLMLLLGVGGALGTTDVCRAEIIAADSASDPAYADGWQGLHGVVTAETGMDNGGFGFLPWDFDDTYWDGLHSPYDLPHFIDTRPTSFNNLGAPAFAFTNGNVPYEGYTTTATRPFASPLQIGDQISIDIDNPLMQKLAPFDSAGFVIELQTASGSERFGFFTTQDFNDDQWTITDSRGSELPSGFGQDAGTLGFKLAFKLIGAEVYQLTITPRGGGAPLVFEGALTKPGTGEISRLQLLMWGNGSGDGRVGATGEREFYFNNLAIEASDVPLVMQRPSDCNQDGALDLSDAVCLLLRLFQGGGLPCGGSLLDAGNINLLDANGDAGVDLSDAIWVLTFLFNAGNPPVLGSHCRQMDGCPNNAERCQ
jgi:hypothetical protein